MPSLNPLFSRIDRRTSFGGWFILLIGIICTALAVIESARKEEREARSRLQYESNFLMRRIKTRLDRYTDALLQAKAFLSSHHSLTQKEFDDYVKSTSLLERLTGFREIGASVFVAPKDLNKFQVWPKGKRETYTPIVYLSPILEKRGSQSLGYDMFSEPHLREAMERARDLDELQATDLISFVKEDGEKKLVGFSVYLAVYRNNFPTETVEQRRKAIKGHVYASFLAPVFFEEIFVDVSEINDVEVYAGSLAEKDKLFYDHSSVKLNETVPRQFRFGGKTFTVIFTPKPRNIVRESLIITFYGTVATVLILWIWFLSRKQARIAHIIASENERLLQQEKRHVAARDEFLSIASHELKTPLTSLKLQAQVMQRALLRQDPKALSEERIRALVNQIDGQTTRLTRLVDDMLDLSRIRTGKLHIEKSEVDLLQTVEDVLEKLRPQFVERTGKAPDLKLLRNCQGRWDRFRIEQVLTNLLTNALKYGKQKPVEVVVGCDERFAIVDVIDQGIGIVEENLPKIFNRFERAGISANEVSGLGLGLFITRQIVKAHGGDILVKSELGKGSTFTLILPLGKEEDTADDDP